MLPCYIAFNNLYTAVEQNITCYCYHNVQKLLMLWFQLLIILRGQEYIKFYSYVKVLKLQN